MTHEEIIAYVQRRHASKTWKVQREGDRVVAVLEFRTKVKGSDAHHVEIDPSMGEPEIDALFEQVEYCGCFDCRRLEFRIGLW